MLRLGLEQLSWFRRISCILFFFCELQKKGENVGEHRGTNTHKPTRARTHTGARVLYTEAQRVTRLHFLSHKYRCGKKLFRDKQPPSCCSEPTCSVVCFVSSSKQPLEHLVSSLFFSSVDSTFCVGSPLVLLLLFCCLGNSSAFASFLRKVHSWSPYVFPPSSIRERAVVNNVTTKQLSHITATMSFRQETL